MSGVQNSTSTCRGIEKISCPLFHHSDTIGFDTSFVVQFKNRTAIWARNPTLFAPIVVGQMHRHVVESVLVLFLRVVYLQGVGSRIYTDRNYPNVS